MEIFFTILIMTLVVSLSGVFTRVLPFQLPLPLMQIAIGALLAWPTFGLHVEFDPELFWFCSSRRCSLPMAGRRQRVSFSSTGERFSAGAGAGTGHGGRHWLYDLLASAGDPSHPSLCAGCCAIANRCCRTFRHCGRGTYTEENHGYPAGRSVDERRLRSGLSEVCRRRGDGDNGIHRWWRNA